MSKPVRHAPIVKGVPRLLHGGDYNPDQWLRTKDETWKEDMRLARLAGVNTLSVGIFAWAALEPEEGRYEFGWLDEILDLMAENDITAVLATPTGARPGWMSHRYPEVLRVDGDRTRNLHGGRHNHCLTSPVYREKTLAINTALAERYGAHPALGVWHISNEYGGECHCDLCQERFRAHLQEKYGSLDELNEAWWSAFWAKTYSDWSHIESPSTHWRGEQDIHGLHLDWMRFTTEQFVDFYLHETAPLKAITPDVPCTTNLMGTYPGIDYYRLAEVLDVVSWDSYPQWSGTGRDVRTGVEASFHHDLTRSLKGKPFMLMESSPSATNWRPVAKLHRPGVHLLQSLQAVAHGADTVQYFQFRKGRGGSEKFHGAIVDHEGTENTRVFRDVAEVGARLAAMDAVVGTSTPADVALVYDWHNRWALDDMKGLLQGKTDYFGTVVDHYQAFWQQGVPVDVLDGSLVAAPGCLDRYKVLVAPMLYMLRPGVAEAIDAFVQRGGTFVATYATGYVDENDKTFLGGFPGPLRATLGVWAEEIDALYPDDRNAIAWDGADYEAFGLCELIHAEGADVLGAYGSDFYAGRPALTVNRRGEGKAYFIAARTGADFLDAFYGGLIAETGVERALATALPAGVTAQVRSDGETDHVFVLNCNPAPATVEIDGETLELAAHGNAVFERPRK
ncbi:beta-galactosidase [Glycomyces niveus]|uniref:Beta-galactosidase n=1 Tax=Glycomyces niveus TaxID=2820287 RepID=A0ABS3U6N5_9ACTN|nr:beta-galactosidase [Glycomyces sp. NEAU-S30]MBO3734415.1 beta-galactosidase [Glycomyces sp. NEAU-S30]